MQRFILALVLLALVACPRPSSPDAGKESEAEAGPDCNLEAGVVYVPAPTKIETHFSPKGGCQDAVVVHIKTAKKVRVQAYTLTAKPVVDALVEAGTRGADVAVILDSLEAKMAVSPVPALRTGKIAVFIDAMHALAHNKVMIFDDATVLTGSYNFTNASEEKNAENCVFIEDAGVAASFLANWNAHREHVSVP